ncbi:unnamed protein product [Microthlaspi erraticum]|uniref:F-box domain-containing protein n=1 Tax=Microthlaspi erraticum TaxID=1685480 RepID=A0A6D2JH49_9BRAS|nr:unnamed protein product [Microthlaspi erraticum]
MDHVSSLPNELLCHILSFLTTKEAALTSVLSKRWLNLLAFVPNLVLDDSMFLHPEECKREREGIVQSFEDFVDRVLALQGHSSIKRFSLKCENGVDKDRVNRWICNVLHRGVSDLELFIFDHRYVLPQETFVSRTLLKLKLTTNFGDDPWSGVEGAFLPMLKTLSSNNCWVCSDKLEILLRASPLLEDSHIRSAHWRKETGVTVSSASLKKLTINALGSVGIKNPKSICFDTPSLLYLDYSDLVSEDYPKLNLEHLVEARLNLMAEEGQSKLIRGLDIEDDEVRPFGNVWKVMSAIRNVRKLGLSSETLEVYSVCRESMPVFHNLKWLEITSNKVQGWQAMPVLLRNCPHLETLVLKGLEHYVTDKCGDACDCISREDKGRSLKSCPVKKIEIKSLRGTEREMEMVKHFLESFPCLKEMEMHVEDEDKLSRYEDPINFEYIVKMVDLYNGLSSCHVRFLPVK